MLTPNRNLKIAGYKIKIAGDHAANGVWFANRAIGERIGVDDPDWDRRFLLQLLKI
ncbi:MAG: DUF4469 domain-containing protein [Prevotellaceae bacterium]|nr:DUF4469 domain-containing protein [Prevotellaceae bacterium]